MINGVVVLAAFFSAATFALIHLLSNRIYRYSERHRSKMLSFFGGISAAYVFLDLLPRLETTRVHLRTVFGEIPAFLDILAVPGLAFLGFMAFFVLEHFAVYTRRSKHAKVGGEIERVSASKHAFAIHFVSIAFLNLIIGYILRFEAEAGALPLLFYTAALSLHFIILDDTMEQHYKQVYVRFGRYFASMLPLVGWGISVFFPENPSEGYLLLGVILGVILFNAVKDAVPKSGGKNSSLFVSGALIYSVLLLVAAWLSGG
jgi:zinc transporter ZupT